MQNTENWPETLKIFLIPCSSSLHHLSLIWLKIFCFVCCIMGLCFLGSIRLFVHRSSLVSTWLLLVSIHFHWFPKAFHSLSIGFRQFSQICHFLSWDGLAGFCRLLSAVSVSNRKTSKCLFPYGTFFSNYWWSVMIIFLILNNFKLLHWKVLMVGNHIDLVQRRIFVSTKVKQ